MVVLDGLQVASQVSLSELRGLFRTFDKAGPPRSPSRWEFPGKRAVLYWLAALDHRDCGNPNTDAGNTACHSTGYRSESSPPRLRKGKHSGSQRCVRDKSSPSPRISCPGSPAPWPCWSPPRSVLSGPTSPPSDASWPARPPPRPPSSAPGGSPTTPASRSPRPWPGWSGGWSASARSGSWSASTGSRSATSTA